jgi:hypothetical protein
MHKKNPFKYFKASHQIIRLAVIYYVRYQLSFRRSAGPAKSRIYYTNAELISAKKQFSFGLADTY